MSNEQVSEMRAKIHLELDGENEILEIKGSGENLVTLFALAYEADSNFLQLLRIAVKYCEHRESEMKAE